MLIKKKKIPITLLVFSFLTLFIYLIVFNLPLTNILGYEFSAASALIQFLLIGLSTIYLNRNPEYISSRGKRFPLFIAAIFLPFVVSIFLTMTKSICPINDGLLFYIIITIPAGYFGFAMGKFSANLFHSILSYVSFVFLIFILIAQPIWEIFTYPQIYFYNPIITFFPGTIYDELITIDWSLLLYRLMTLGVISTFHGAAYLISQFNSVKYFIGAIPIVLLLSMFYLGPELNFATNYVNIKQNLKKETVTSFITTRYEESIDSLIEKNIVLNQEFYYEKIQGKLGFTPLNKIQSYVFENREQKRKLFGAANADVAKPWLSQIYIEKSSEWSTVKHELVHAFTGRIGVTPFKVANSFNPAVIEGFAMAIENNYGGYNPHFLAYLAEKSNFKIPLKSIFSGLSFFINASSLSYIYSGSFFKYLGDRYSYQKLAEFYSNSDFKTYFDADIETLEKQYLSFLDSLNFQYNQATADLFFGRKSIFKKFCPREAAKDLSDADELFLNGNFASSEKMYQRVYSYSESYRALRGQLASLKNLHNISSADSVLSKEIEKFKGTSYYFSLELAAGDFKSLLGESDSAFAFYSNVSKQNPSIDYQNAAELRIKLLHRGLESFQHYLNGSEPERKEILEQLNSKEIFYQSFPTLLELAKSAGTDYREIESKYFPKFKVTDLVSAYAAKSFSEYLTFYGSYEPAIKLAQQSVRFADNRFEEVWSENLEKIIWFRNFASGIIENTNFNSY